MSSGTTVLLEPATDSEPVGGGDTDQPMGPPSPPTGRAVLRGRPPLPSGGRLRLVAIAMALAVLVAVTVAAWPRSGPGHSAATSSSASSAGVAPAVVRGNRTAAGSSAGAGAAGSGAGAGPTAQGGGSPAASSPGGASSAGGVASGTSGTSGGTAAAALPPTPLVTTKVIENGQIDLQVPKGRISSAVSSLTLLAAREGGFVASTAQSSSGGGPSGSVTLRIPNSAFGDALDQVRSLGKVESSNVTGQDVTAQYQDLSDQITALRQAQSQFLTIMARASTVGDILAVQEQVDSVDSQLQQLLGQQRVLDDQTTYATLSVSLAQPGLPAPRPTPVTGAWSTAVRRAAGGFADGLQGLIAVSGALAFAVLITLALGLLGLTVWRRLARPVQASAGQL